MKNDLRVELGLDASGEPVVLDLDEKGDGPHGVIVGATGSGKTVLLKWIIAQLCAKNAPEALAIRVLDPIGSYGSVQARSSTRVCSPPAVEVFSLERPGRDESVERFVEDVRDMIEQRLRRLLDTDSTQASNAGPPLVLVVDAFDTLLTTGKSRELEEALYDVGRIGRALGIHLLVACQNAREIRILLQNFSYRIVFDVDPRSSKELIGDWSAHHLPRGHAVLRSHAREVVPVAFAHIGAGE